MAVRHPQCETSLPTVVFPGIAMKSVRGPSRKALHCLEVAAGVAKSGRAPYAERMRPHQPGLHAEGRGPELHEALDHVA